MKITELFKKVFEGIGCIEGKYDIKIDEKALSIACITRKIPFASEKSSKKDLNKLRELNVIQKVEEYSE